jgi:hypothetical protein
MEHAEEQEGGSHSCGVPRLRALLPPLSRNERRKHTRQLPDTPSSTFRNRIRLCVGVPNLSSSICASLSSP